MTQSDLSRSERSTERPTKIKQHRGPLAAGMIGNIVEWYDFAIYGYLSFALAPNFFPGDGVGPMLSTFAVFGVAFFFRPVGAVIIGSVGDRVGRKTILALVVLTIAAATTLIGLLPTFDRAGWLAPALLVILRAIQGIAAGGEYGGASSFVFEYAPKNRRGLFGGALGSSTYVAYIMASLLVFGLTSAVGKDAMLDWGWRIPFLAAIPLGVVGLYLRWRVEETPEFREVSEEDAVETAPLRRSIVEQHKRIMLLVGFLISNAVGPYLLTTYIPTFLGSEKGLTSTQLLVATCVVMLFMCVLLPVAGAISDRVGRKPVMYASTVLFIATPLPAFLLFEAGTSTFTVLLGMGMIGVAQAASTGVTAVLISEMFPTSLRYSSASISYNLAYALFGGTSPLVAAWLTAATGSVIAPAIYVMTIAAISTVVIAFLPETRARTGRTKGLQESRRPDELDHGTPPVPRDRRPDIGRDL